MAFSKPYHSLQADEIAMLLPLMRFLDVLHLLARFCASLDDIVELQLEEVSTDKHHYDRNCAEISDAHQEEEDGLLPIRRGADIDRRQSGHCHGGYADEETIDKRNRGGVGCIEDSSKNERCQSEYDDVNTLGSKEIQRNE